MKNRDQKKEDRRGLIALTRPRLDDPSDKGGRANGLAAGDDGQPWRQDAPWTPSASLPDLHPSNDAPHEGRANGRQSVTILDSADNGLTQGCPLFVRCRKVVTPCRCTDTDVTCCSSVTSDAQATHHTYAACRTADTEPSEFEQYRRFVTRHALCYIVRHEHESHALHHGPTSRRSHERSHPLPHRSGPLDDDTGRRTHSRSPRGRQSQD